jgi:hypothetical protein
MRFPVSPLQVAVAVPLSLGLQKFFGVKGNSSEPDAGDQRTADASMAAAA